MICPIQVRILWFGLVWRPGFKERGFEKGPKEPASRKDDEHVWLRIPEYALELGFTKIYRSLSLTCHVTLTIGNDAYVVTLDQISFVGLPCLL